MKKLFSRAPAAPLVQPRIDMSRMRASMAPLPASAVAAPKPEYDRVTPRADTWSVGKVTLATGQTRECVLIDLSDTGARIRFRTRGMLSGIVKLKSSRHQIDREARVVWKDMYDAGLEFLDVEPEAD